jgi:hypothetical protein
VADRAVTITAAEALAIARSGVSATQVLRDIRNALTAGDMQTTADRLMVLGWIDPENAQTIVDALDLAGRVGWDGRPPVVTPRDIPPAGNAE